MVQGLGWDSRVRKNPFDMMQRRFLSKHIRHRLPSMSRVTQALKRVQIAAVERVVRHIAVCGTYMDEDHGSGMSRPSGHCEELERNCCHRRNIGCGPKEVRVEERDGDDEQNEEEMVV